MANEQDKLIVEIVLDDGSIKKGFVSMESQAKKTSSSLTSTLGGSFSKIGAAVGAIGAAFASGAFLGKAIEEAKNAEKANNAFAASLAQIGAYSQDAVTKFSNYADALSAQTGISDDAIKGNASMLVTLGKLSGEGLERATAASLDLAQALQIDIGTAFDMVAKSANGTVGTLSKYGFSVDKNLSSSDKFQSILGQIEGRFGGLAKTNLNTFSGQMDNLGNSFNKIFEAVGGLFTGGGDGVLKKAIGFFADFFRQTAGFIEEWGQKNQSVISQLVDNFITLGSVINTVVIRPIELLGRISYVVFNGIITGINAIIAGSFQVGKAINEYILKPLSIGKSFGQFIETAADSSASVFAESMAQTQAAMTNTLNGSVTESIGGFIENFRTTLSSTTSPVEEFKNRNIEAIEETKNAWQEYAFSFSSSIESIKGGFREAVYELAGTKEAMAKGFAAIGKSALQGMANTVGNAFASFGKALATGEDAAQAFVNSFLSSIGQMLIQMGTSYILQGIAASANPLTPGMGGPLIAAGAAMAAFGGVLSAIGGSGGGASTASAGGGGVAAEPSPTTELPTQNEIVAQEPNTEVQVVINGSIYDSDETGSRIVSLINDAFDKKGVVIQRGVMA